MSSTKGAERLAGRTALVTGASRGIGRAVAIGLANEGARVSLMARSDQALSDLVRALGPRASAVVCDVADADAVARAARRVTDALGSTPDVLVNNAGAFALAPVEHTDPGVFIAAIDTNLVAPFLFARAFLPGMRARGSGHLVTIGSIADRAVFPGNGAYAASKHGARALHEVLRLELRGTGLRTTLVSPGPVDTALWDSIDPDNRDGFTRRADMLSAEAVAEAVIFAITQPAEVNIDEIRMSRS
jgi:NADP-dependent 3-hydroxy acid dehydrogenase YdfG